MAGRRRKRRTHKNVGEESGHRSLPKSFVVRIGPADSCVTQLVRDFRRVMEPLTAIRLRERKSNKLKDYQAVAGPLGVTHFYLFKETEEHNLNLRLGVFPGGPTLYYRVCSFALMKDVQGSMRRPHPPNPIDFVTSPLVVLAGFQNNVAVEDRLQCAVLQNAFPCLIPSETELKEVRRVVLFQKQADGLVKMRHYLINVKDYVTGEEERVMRRLKRAEKLDLSGYQDIADYVFQGVETSESEGEPTITKVLSSNDNKKNKNNSNKTKDKEEKEKEKEKQKKIRLVEIGPRVDLELVRVCEGLNGGKVLYYKN